MRPRRPTPYGDPGRRHATANTATAAMTADRQIAHHKAEYLLIAKLAITRRVSEAIAHIFFQTDDRFSIFFDA